MNLVLMFAVIAAFPCIVVGQQPESAKAKKSENIRPIELRGKVKSIDNKAKTYIVIIENEEVTISATKMKRLPKVGSVVRFTEHSKFIFPSCEECNGVCPGVCFLTSALTCRCYLEHL